jgi:hypothetical protein
MVVSLIPRISRSKSKAELYRQLGLTEGEESHDRLYKLMMVSPLMRLRMKTNMIPKGRGQCRARSDLSRSTELGSNEARNRAAILSKRRH